MAAMVAATTLKVGRAPGVEAQHCRIKSSATPRRTKATHNQEAPRTPCVGGPGCRCVCANMCVYCVCVRECACACVCVACTTSHCNSDQRTHLGKPRLVPPSARLQLRGPVAIPHGHTQSVKGFQVLHDAAHWAPNRHKQGSTNSRTHTQSRKPIASLVGVPRAPNNLRLPNGATGQRLKDHIPGCSLPC
jgi:hypothetical protein